MGITLVEDDEFLGVRVLAGVNRRNPCPVCRSTIINLKPLHMVPEATFNGQTWMNLGKEATDIAAQLAPEAIAKNIDLELITPDTPLKIKGNSTAIGDSLSQHGRQCHSILTRKKQNNDKNRKK